MRRPLVEIAVIQIGYQPRARIENDPMGTHCVIQMSDVAEGSELANANLSRITLEKDLEKYGVGSGDVLFQARGSRQEAFALREVPANAVASNHFFIVRPRTDTVLPEYLAWYLNQQPVRSHLSKRSQGTTTMLVTKDVFAELEIELPPLEIQKKIIEVAALRGTEKMLTQQLDAKRDVLAHATCLQAARQGRLRR